MAGGTPIHFLAMAHLRPYVDVEPLLRQVVWGQEISLILAVFEQWRWGYGLMIHSYFYTSKSSNVYYRRSCLVSASNMSVIWRFEVNKFMVFQPEETSQDRPILGHLVGVREAGRFTATIATTCFSARKVETPHLAKPLTGIRRFHVEMIRDMIHFNVQWIQRYSKQHTRLTIWVVCCFFQKLWQMMALFRLWPLMWRCPLIKKLCFPYHSWWFKRVSRLQSVMFF